MVLEQLVKRFMSEEQYMAWRRKRRIAALPPALKARHDAEAARKLAADPGAEASIRASLDWILEAQRASPSADGGVARDYSLLTGWAPSYPETTGYVIPTMLREAELLKDPALHASAIRMLDWLAAIQLEGGGFQGGRIDQTPVVPVTFNTGQILIGLAVAVQRGHHQYADAMHGAARILANSLDPDGCWRSHPTPFAKPGDKAYETHVAWGLFEAERAAPGHGYGAAGLTQVDWALTRQQANGWFLDNCLTNPAAPLTHTIGYVLRGVIEAWRISKDQRYLDAAILTANGAMAAIEADGWLPGRLDANWKGCEPSVCLTGSAQIALCWFMLAEATGDARYDAAARKVLGFVRQAVPVTGTAELRGAVMGSCPFSGGYTTFEAPNWAAKFFIDANRMDLDRAAGRSVLNACY